MLDWELDKWLTKTGDVVVRKDYEKGAASLTAKERLLLEVWLLDTETRNGGISQYFCNRGRKRWELLERYAIPALNSFGPFAKQVNALIQDASDPYKAIITSKIKLDDVYNQEVSNWVQELKTAYEAP